jgi:hypothetical protein
MIHSLNSSMRLCFTIGLYVMLLTVDATAKNYAFLVVGDPQYLAEKAKSPTQLDRFSEEANSQAIELLNNFSGMSLSPSDGGVKVSEDILGLIVTGDLIDSADKNGGYYPAMQRFEWDRYKADYGLTGKDGKIPFPVYELHGNHDGPQGDTFIVEDIIRRNTSRPGLQNRSENGLHYSWNWGPLHCVNLGMFVGEGEKRRKDHHYAPRASLEFLRKDLEKEVGDSGRPVILSFHLHPFGPEYDWPKEDLAAFWEVISPYNVIAMFHGHTHGSPPSKTIWDGEQFGPKRSAGIDIFNPDDIGASKTDPKDPGKGVGLYHGLLYVELIDCAGVENDLFIVRSYATKDNWKTHGWHTTWSRSVIVPD